MRTAAEKQGAMSLACTLVAAVRHIFQYFYLPERIPSCFLVLLTGHFQGVRGMQTRNCCNTPDGILWLRILRAEY